MSVLTSTQPLAALFENPKLGRELTQSEIAAVGGGNDGDGIFICMDDKATENDDGTSTWDAGDWTVD